MKNRARSMRRAARVSARLARFVLRRPRQAVLVGRMATVVVLLSLAARLLPMPRMMWALKPLRSPRRAADPEATQRELARLLDALLAADFFVFEPKCWKRAPVLYRFLALSGVESSVVFGMRREEGGRVAGHAWVEAGGRPILEACPPDYSVTYVFPPGASAPRAANLRRDSIRQG
jgi:hypothetical protein